MAKRSKFAVGGVALAVTALLISTQAVSQEKPLGQPAGEEQWGQMMARWKELNAKGAEHEKFKQMVGTWETEMRVWMAPGMEPTVPNGTAEIRLILGRRYIQQTYRCESGIESGSLEGLSTEGYDRFKKKHASIWIDNMSTGIFLSEGTIDVSGKICTHYGKPHDPLTGELDKVVRSVVREISPDKVISEMYEKRAGQDEFKSMETVYTRKKSVIALLSP